MKVLVCGDRNWTNRGSIKSALKMLLRHHSSGKIIVIDGAAKGADTIAHEVADELRMFAKQYPADWNQYGKAAGPIRNIKMLKHGKPDLVLAFHLDLKKSKGTKHMVEIARKAGVEVIVFNE